MILDKGLGLKKVRIFNIIYDLFTNKIWGQPLFLFFDQTTKNKNL